MEISNEGNKTKEDIYAEAIGVWNYCKEIFNGTKSFNINNKKNKKPKQKITEKDYEILDQLYEEISTKHKAFCTAYPTVARHMVQEQQFYPHIFKEYLDEVEKSPWTNDDERLDSYTNYFMMLFKEANKGRHLNMTELSSVKLSYRTGLQREHDYFINKYKVNKETIEKKYAEADERRKESLISAFKRYCAEINKKYTNPEEQISQQYIDNVISLVKSDNMRLDHFEQTITKIKKILINEN